MKANDISPNETNQQQPNLNPPANSQKITNNNSSQKPIDISISNTSVHQNELINNKNGSKNETHLREKMKLSTGAPFKSLIKEEDIIIPDSDIFNNSLNNIPSNPFLNKDLNKSNNSNQQDANMKKPEINMRKNRTQFIRNSINVIPQPESKITTSVNKGIIRIKLFKSQIKPRRPNPYECEKVDNECILEPNTQFKIGSNNVSNDKVSAVSDFGDKNIQYKSLIKRIADKLKRKNKKPTKGYFYVSIIRSDKYLNKIKNIAKKMKNQVCPPTHGFFYAYIEKEKQYRLLIKRIALLLKKRIKFPTCKIIKVYESYRILIKRIANILKKAMMKKSNLNLENNKNNINVEKKDNAIEVEDNTNDIIMEKSINIPNDIEKKNNNSNEVVPKEENNINANDNKNNAQNDDEENKMDLDIEMKDIKTEIEKKEQSDKDIHQNEKGKEEDKEKGEENEAKLDIDKNEVKPETDKKEEENNKNCPNVVENSTGIKIEENIKTNFTPLTYNKDSKSNLVQNIINDNINMAGSNYSFSKMDIVQKELPNSAEPKTLNSIYENNDKIDLEQIEQFDKIEQNAKGPILPKENKINNSQEQREKSIQDIPIEIQSNHNNQKSEHAPTEIIKKEDDNVPLHACQIIRNSKYTKTLPYFSKRNKSIKINIPIFQKEKITLNELDERKIHNRTHTKNDINLNLDNFSNFYKKKEEQNANDNLTLSDIEVSKSNFINNFKKFLDQEKIEIINNYPVSLNEKHKIYFYQSNFWYLIITYLFYQNNNLSLYEIIHLLEQYNMWSKDKNEEIFSSIKEKIEEYIKKNYSNEIIEQFLFMNKLSDINQIFQKYEIYGNNTKINKLYEYKEIKIDNINIIHDKMNTKCKCDLCTNDESCIQKVCDLNKSRIHIVNNSDIELDALTPEQQYQNLIKKCNNNNMLHINEALFYEGIPQKKQNCCFSKSKTIFEEKTNIEYNYLPPVKEKIEEKVNTDINMNDNNVSNHNDSNSNNGNDKDKGKDKEILCDGNNDKENDVISNGNSLVNNKNITDDTDITNQNLDEIIENGEKSKNFKKVSKFKKEEEKDKEKEKENSVDSEKVTKSEKYTNSNSAESERSDKLDEIESADEDKNKKKDKKIKKIKSRKNKKKKDITKNKNEKDVEENGEDEKSGKEKEKIENEKKEEEKSNKKRKKTGNGMKKSNNNNKSFEKNEDEKNELKKMLQEDTTEIKKEDENFNDNNSKRKKSKSKSPNKKKNRKH